MIQNQESLLGGNKGTLRENLTCHIAILLVPWPTMLCIGSRIVNVLPSTVSLAESCSSCSPVFHEQQRQVHNLEHHHSPWETTISPLGPCAFK